MVASSECKGEWRVAEAMRRDERGDFDEIQRREVMFREICGSGDKARLSLCVNELKANAWS